MAKKIPKFDPNAKVYEVNERDVPQYDPSAETFAHDYIPPLVRESGGAMSLEQLGEAAQAVGGALDIPGAATRTVVSGLGKGTAIEDLGQLGSRILEKGPKATFEAPTGGEILEQYDLMPKGLPGWAEKGLEIGTEAILDPTMVVAPVKAGLRAAVSPATKLTKAGVRRVTGGLASKHAKKAIAKMSTPGKASLKKGIDFGQLGARVVEDELAKYIKNPSRMLEKLVGKRTLTKSKAAGGHVYKSTARDGGLIKEAAEELQGVVNDISARGYSNVYTDEIKLDQMTKYLNEQLDKTSGFFRNDREMQNIGARIQGILGESEKFNLNEVYELKKNIGKQIRDTKFYATPSEAMEQKTEVLLNLQRHLDDIMKDKLSGIKVKVGKDAVDAGEYYALQNNRLNSYLNLRDILEPYIEKGIKDPGLMEQALGIATGAATYGAVGLGAELMGMQGMGKIGAMVGAGIETSRRARKAVTENLPANIVRGTEMLERLPEIAAPYGAATTRALSDRQQERRELINPGRTPQSVSMPTNLPKMLINTKLPRTVQGVLENKDVLLAKVAQEAPHLFEEVKFVIEERPEDVDQILPMAMHLLPQAFERDKYNRVDNVILEPMMKEKARKDIMEDERLSNGQKVKLINKMNRTGILEGY